MGEQLRSLAAAHSGGERDGEPGHVDLRGRQRWMGLFFSLSSKKLYSKTFFMAHIFYFLDAKSFYKTFVRQFFLFLMKKFTKIFYLILDAKVVSSKKFLKIFS